MAKIYPERKFVSRRKLILRKEKNFVLHKVMGKTPLWQFRLSLSNSIKCANKLQFFCPSLVSIKMMAGVNKVCRMCMFIHAFICHVYM